MPVSGHRSHVPENSVRFDLALFHAPVYTTCQTCKLCSRKGHILRSKVLCRVCKVNLCLNAEINCFINSPKDHDHIRRTKNSCCDLQIRPDMIHDMIHVTPRAKFMDNTHNKSELIHLLSSTVWKSQITVVQYDNDADTSIVRAALAAATEDSVEVRAEDVDVLIMLVYHSSSSNHPLFLTTSKGSYDVRRIREALSERQRRYLVFCHAFTGCDTVSAIGCHGKTTLFDRFCAGDIDEHMDIFLDVRATKDEVIGGGITIFQHIYNAPGTTLGAIRYNMFARKAAAGLIKPKTLPPTEGPAAHHHSLRAYLQTRDWMLLQGMSLDPSDYGWTVGVHGNEPVPTLNPMAPEDLLQFRGAIVMEITATGGTAARKMMSSVSQHAEVVKALHARIVSMMV
ncbi:hypothetical protein GWK47_033118 [Chionoecetes opilio]|uniref:Uncharacterized protein n=1 Tax=Chionoecetes opilio TaxID=41210 RepID=A0A8J4YHG2_CHIOP|nr:hypothetical protein GWK47_033118 [Chionoecetes opilio]